MCGVCMHMCLVYVCYMWFLWCMCVGCVVCVVRGVVCCICDVWVWCNVCMWVFTASISIQAVCQAGSLGECFPRLSLLASDHFGSVVVVGSGLSEGE